MRVQFVPLLQKDINISLSKREVGCHTNRTTSMAEEYWHDAIVLERTFQLLLEHLSYTYVQTKELQMLYNGVRSLTCCKYHAGVLHYCCPAGAHSQPLCLQELYFEKEAVSSELD